MMYVSITSVSRDRQTEVCIGQKSAFPEIEGCRFLSFTSARFANSLSLMHAVEKHKKAKLGNVADPTSKQEGEAKH